MLVVDEQRDNNSTHQTAAELNSTQHSGRDAAHRIATGIKGHFLGGHM